MMTTLKDYEIFCALQWHVADVTVMLLCIELVLESLVDFLLKLVKFSSTKFNHISISIRISLDLYDFLEHFILTVGVPVIENELVRGPSIRFKLFLELFLISFVEPIYSQLWGLMRWIFLSEFENQFDLRHEIELLTFLLDP